MGEIKSTLELALERTRKLAITQEEKEEIKRQELLKKATGKGPSHEFKEDFSVPPQIAFLLLARVSRNASSPSMWSGWQWVVRIRST